MRLPGLYSDKLILYESREVKLLWTRMKRWALGDLSITEEVGIYLGPMGANGRP